MFLVPNRRASFGYEIGSAIAREGDYDRQRSVFDAIAAGALDVNGQKIAELNEYAPGTRIALADLSRLADVVVVRSWAEAEYQRLLRGYGLSNVVRWYPSRDLGDWQPSARRRHVVIWAPELHAERTAIHTFALADLHADIIVVHRGGTGISARARYVEVTSPEVASLLADALCVVDTTIDDPSWTQAFAAREVSVAAPTTSGAHEVAGGIALYEPWSHKAIWAATLEAMSRKASHAREAPPSPEVIARALEATRPVPPDDAPLVSVVIPTYNRRDDLLRILRKLKEQAYSNFEIIVVNDGGTPVADVASVDPRIKVIDRETNVGISLAVNFGLSQAQGKYISLLADDDELYPDHLIRLVGALERSRAMVAHSNVLIRYEEVRNGTSMTTGYNCSVFCHPVDRTEVYASSPVAGQALMIRRDAFENVGAFREDLILADQEIQIRLAQISDFVHVPHVTAEWLVREGGGGQFSHQKKKDLPADLRRVFALHPAQGRPYVAAMREATLRNVEARPPGFIFPPVIWRGKSP